VVPAKARLTRNGQPTTGFQAFATLLTAICRVQVPAWPTVSPARCPWVILTTSPSRSDRHVGDLHAGWCADDRATASGSMLNLLFVDALDCLVLVGRATHVPQAAGTSGIRRSVTVTSRGRWAGRTSVSCGGEEAETAWHARGQGLRCPGVPPRLVPGRFGHPLSRSPSPSSNERQAVVRERPLVERGGAAGLSRDGLPANRSIGLRAEGRWRRLPRARP